MEHNELKPCPFCGDKNIAFSIKTTTVAFKRAYHFAMYCMKCHCYGRRVFWLHDGEMNRIDIERNEDFKQQAIDAWNRRANDEL